MNPHKQSTRVFVNYNDGTDIADHPISSTGRTALQTILYCDNMEIVNPLGSSAGVHKFPLFTSSITLINTMYPVADSSSSKVSPGWVYY